MSRKGRILWVDDSFGPLYRVGSCNSLVWGVFEAGYEIELYGRLWEAEERLKFLGAKTTVDFVFLDFNLHPEDGGEKGRLRFIREVLNPLSLRFATVSGESSREFPWEHSGVFTFQKGFPVSGLLTLLESYITSRASVEERRSVA